MVSGFQTLSLLAEDNTEFTSSIVARIGQNLTLRFQRGYASHSGWGWESHLRHFQLMDLALE
jgi:hypothetical protein